MRDFDQVQRVAAAVPSDGYRRAFFALRALHRGAGMTEPFFGSYFEFFVFFCG
jgi:hypothetical protein